MDYEAASRRLVDKADILDRKHAYLRAVDAGDADRIVQHFAPDGFLADLDPTTEPIHGKEAVRGWFADRLSQVVASSHHLFNADITFESRDHATLRCYFYSWQRFAGHPRTPDRHRFARYLDTWTRTDLGWMQNSLTCLVAGEYCSDARPRMGEYFDWVR